VALPAVAIRGSTTRLNGVEQLALSTKNLDVSVSKGFAFLTPFAGVGSVWVDCNPNAGTLKKETFRQSKAFAGVNINMGFSNFVIEYDKTGSSTSYSAKLGFRF